MRRGLPVEEESANDLLHAGSPSCQSALTCRTVSPPPLRTRPAWSSAAGVTPCGRSGQTGMTGFQREEDRLHFPLLLGALAASWYLSRCAAIDPSASPADHIPWPARLTARSRQRGCADPGVTVVAAR